MWSQSYNFLDTLAASGADVIFNNHILQVTGSPQIDFRKIEAVQLIPPTNELLQVQTVTPTAANSTTFSIFIQQVVNGRLIGRVFSYDTAASGDTATTICNAWRSAINLDSSVQITATGTATLILTAKTGFPLFSVTSLSGANSIAATVSGKSAFTGGTFTASTATFGVTSHGYAVGDTVSITAATTTVFSVNGTAVSLPFTGVVNTVANANSFTLYGVTGSADGTAVAGSPLAAPAVGTGTLLNQLSFAGGTAANNYFQYVFQYSDNNVVGNATFEGHPRRHYMLINVGSSNYNGSGNFDQKMRAALADVTTFGGSTASPEATAII